MVVIFICFNLLNLFLIKDFNLTLFIFNYFLYFIQLFSYILVTCPLGDDIFLKLNFTLPEKTHQNLINLVNKTEWNRRPPTGQQLFE